KEASIIKRHTVNNIAAATNLPHDALHKFWAGMEGRKSARLAKRNAGPFYGFNKSVTSIVGGLVKNVGVALGMPEREMGRHIDNTFDAASVFTTDKKVEGIIQGGKYNFKASFGMQNSEMSYNDGTPKTTGAAVEELAKRAIIKRVAKEFGISENLVGAGMRAEWGRIEQKKADKKARSKAISSTIQTAVLAAVSMGALSALGSVGSAVGSAMQSVANVGSQIFSAVGNVASGVGSAISSGLSAVTGGMSTVVTNAIGNGIGYIANGATNVATAGLKLPGATSGSLTQAQGLNMLIKTAQGSRHGIKGALVGAVDGILGMGNSSQSSLGINLEEVGKKQPWEIGKKKKLRLTGRAQVGALSASVNGKGSVSVGYKVGNAGSVNVNLTERSVGGQINLQSVANKYMGGYAPPGITPGLYFQSRSYRRSANQKSWDPLNQKAPNRGTVGLELKTNYRNPGGLTPQLQVRVDQRGDISSTGRLNGVDIIRANRQGTSMNDNILGDYYAQKVIEEKDKALQKQREDSEAEYIKGQKDNIAKLADRLSKNINTDGLSASELAALSQVLHKDAEAQGIDVSDLKPGTNQAAGHSKAEDPNLWEQFKQDMDDAWQIAQGNNVDDKGWVDEKGRYHPRTCFVAGTLVHTRDGLKKIEDIRLGDVVLTKDEYSGEVLHRPVIELFLRKVDILFVLELSNGETIKTTWNHPFWIENKGWTQAKEILVGNKLITPQGGVLEVVSNSQKYVSDVAVYNFGVKETHTYFVGERGVWVHNQAYGMQGFARALALRNICGSDNSCWKREIKKYEDLDKANAIGDLAGIVTLLFGPRAAVGGGKLLIKLKDAYTKNPVKNSKVKNIEKPSGKRPANNSEIQKRSDIVNPERANRLSRFFRNKYRGNVSVTRQHKNGKKETVLRMHEEGRHGQTNMTAYTRNKQNYSKDKKTSFRNPYDKQDGVPLTRQHYQIFRNAHKNTRIIRPGRTEPIDPSKPYLSTKGVR
ncbi:MAG: polymorphic toxin-type HINT domain-containing protein, partial [Spirochaetota bacterium]